MVKSKILLLFVFVLSQISCTFQEQKDLDYKAACERGDFIAAYEIVEYLKQNMVDYESENANSIQTAKYYAKKSGCAIYQDELSTYGNLKNNYDNALKYVVRCEAIKVLETQGVEGLTKIAFIVQEHNASWVYDDLLTLSCSLGDVQLTERLKNICSAMLEQEIIDIQNNFKSSMPNIGIIKSNDEGEIPEYLEYNNDVEAFNKKCVEVAQRAAKYDDNKHFSILRGMVKSSLKWDNLGNWEEYAEHGRHSSRDNNAFRVSIDNSKKQVYIDQINACQKQ